MKFSAFTVIIPSVLLSFAAHTLAGGCGTFTPCGEVENKSSHTLRYTTKLDDNVKAGPDRCDVWNHKGGNALYDPPIPVSCDQVDLKPGKNAGGGNVDVDAFTYHDRQYRVMMNGKAARTIKKGVWTKIGSDEKAICQDNDLLGMPACFVDFDL